MAAATKTCPQAVPEAPVYSTDHKPHTVLGIRATGTLDIDAGETLDMVKIPAGARIIDCVVWGDGAMGCTDIDVGLFRTSDFSTVVNDDGLIEAGDINGAPYAARWTMKAVEIEVGNVQTYETVVRLTARTGDLTDAKTLYCAVTYIMP